MGISSIFDIIGLLFWFMSLIQYINLSTSSGSYNIMREGPIYNLLIYYMFTLRCILSIIYAQNISASTIYINLVFALLNLYSSGYVLSCLIDNNRLFQNVSKSTHYLTIIA